MGSDLDATRHIAAFQKWEREQPRENEVRLEFLEATDTSLNFRTNGMVFQLIFPEDLNAGETFVAMNLDNAAPETLLIGLNEKLERIRGGPSALSQALDILFKGLTSFQGKRRSSNTNSAELSQSLAAVAIDLNNDSDSSSNGEGDLGNGEFDSFLQSLGDFQNLHGRDEQDCNKGCIYRMAKAAREMCNAARQVPFEDNIDPDCVKMSTSDKSKLQDILQYFQVFVIPDLSCVQIQMEVAGVLNGLRLASALGISIHSSLSIFLEFDEVYWSEDQRDQELVVNRITVKPTTSTQPDESHDYCIPTNVSLEATRSELDLEFEAECQRFPGRHKTMAYGIESLLPDLVETYFKFRKGEPFLRGRRWRNASLDKSLKDHGADFNSLVGLMNFVGTQLRASQSWCLICWTELSTSVWRLRTCQDELCLYKFEELGLGSAIYQDIQESPEVAELELSMACAAANPIRDVFEPYPTFLLNENEVRGRSGWFSGQAEQVGVQSTSWLSHSRSTIVQGLLTHPKIPPRIGRRKLEDILDNDGTFASLKNKKLRLLLDILQSIPSIIEMKACSDEKALKRLLFRAAFNWERENQLAEALDFQTRNICDSYDLMRFILSTNRLSLRYLTPESNLDLGSTHQFVVLHNSPEKEARFDVRRAQAGGSFFAFHGSAASNWYSILRNGLRSMSNTRYMSTGAAYGQGIYLASRFDLSYSYALKSEASYTWKQGRFKDGLKLIAICEVVLGITSQEEIARRSSGSGIFVVPPGQEDGVSIRYLIVIDEGGSSQYNMEGFLGCNIAGSVLHDFSRNHVDLATHYADLKVREDIQQQMLLRDCRMEALNRIREHLPSMPVVKPSMPVLMQFMPVVDDATCDLIRSPAITDSKNSTAVNVKWPAIVLSVEGACESTSKKNRAEQEMDTGSSVPLTGKDRAISSPQTINEINFGEGPEVAQLFQSLKRPRNDSTPAMESKRATQTISKVFRSVQTEIQKAKETLCTTGGDAFLANVTVDVPNEADLHLWHVRLHQDLFKSHPMLYKDLQQFPDGRDGKEAVILLEVTFTGSFPFQPPFIRIIHPKFLFHTGHVTVGGSICMELLTNSGWLPSYSMESVLVQIVNAIVEGEGRIDTKARGKEYSKEGAMESFERVARQHGWEK